jgi:predicted dehydrogenase
MPNIRVALIGYGTRLPEIVRHLDAATDAVVYCGVMDPDPERAALALREAAPGGRRYESMQDVVDDPEVDWVFIGSPNHLHARQTILALQAGKHVFCEKPAATSIDDVIAVQEASLNSDRKYVLGLTLRHAEHYRTIKRWLSEERIGRLVSMELNENLEFSHGGHIHSHAWRRRTDLGGSHLLEKCCHDIDLAIWMAESLPAYVASFGGRNIFIPEHADLMMAVQPHPDGRDPWLWWPTVGERTNPFTGDADVVDNQVGIIEFENEIRATFHTNCVAGFPERRMLLLGTRGAIRADLVSGTLEYRPIGFEAEVERADLGSTDLHGGGDPTLAKDLAQTMLEDAPPRAGIREGILSVVTCIALNEAMASRSVVDCRRYWDKAEGRGQKAEG